MPKVEPKNFINKIVEKVVLIEAYEQSTKKKISKKINSVLDKSNLQKTGEKASKTLGSIMLGPIASVGDIIAGKSVRK